MRELARSASLTLGCCPVLEPNPDRPRRTHSISSYGDRPNDFEEVSEYFRAHFIQVHRRKDVSHRPLYLVRLASLIL